jgi:hypothetical protein
MARDDEFIVDATDEDIFAVASDAFITFIVDGEERADSKARELENRRKIDDISMLVKVKVKCLSVPYPRSSC